MKCKIDELDVKGVCIPKRSIRVFDAVNVIDRFTVVLGSDAFGMSINPLHPTGFNQYAGVVGTDVIIEDNPAIGGQVSFDKLPSEVKEAINQRFEMYDKKELEDVAESVEREIRIEENSFGNLVVQVDEMDKYLQAEADVQGFKEILAEDNRKWLDTGGHLTEEDLNEFEISQIIDYFYV